MTDKVITHFIIFGLFPKIFKRLPLKRIFFFNCFMVPWWWWSNSFKSVAETRWFVQTHRFISSTKQHSADSILIALISSETGGTAVSKRFFQLLLSIMTHSNVVLQWEARCPSVSHVGSWTSALQATLTSGALEASFTHSHATRHKQQQQHNILYLYCCLQFMKSIHRHLSLRKMCTMGRAGVMVL